MALKRRRTQKNNTNRRKQQSKRGGKRTRKNRKNNVRNKRQSRRRRGGASSYSNGHCIIFGGDINIGYHGDDTYDNQKGGFAKIFLSPKHQLKFKLKVPNITSSETDIIKALTFNVSHYNMNNKQPKGDYKGTSLQATEDKYKESDEAKWVDSQDKSWNKTIETIDSAIKQKHKVFFFQEIDTNLTSANDNMPGNLGKLLKLFYTNPPEPTTDVLSEPFQSDFENYRKKGNQQRDGLEGTVTAPAPVPKVKIISVEDPNFPYYCLKGVMPYKPLKRGKDESKITKAEVITVYHKELGNPIQANIFNFCGNPTVNDMKSDGRPCLVVITSKGYVLINAHFGQPMPFVEKYLDENQDKTGLISNMKSIYNNKDWNNARQVINDRSRSKQWREWFLNQMSDDFSKCFNKSVPGNDIEYELVIAQDGVIENEIKSCCHGEKKKEKTEGRASDYIASNKKVSGMKCLFDQHGKVGSDHEAVTATIDPHSAAVPISAQ